MTYFCYDANFSFVINCASIVTKLRPTTVGDSNIDGLLLGYTILCVLTKKEDRLFLELWKNIYSWGDISTRLSFGLLNGKSKSVLKQVRPNL